MRSSVRKTLTSALQKKESPLFLSKNKNEIHKYLSKRGFDVKKEEIEEFLEGQQSSGLVIRNDSERLKRETSRAMILAPDFFYWMHGDLAFFSKYRQYGTDATKMILLLIDSLSLMTFLAPLKSTRAKDVIAAFEFVFYNSDYLPERFKRFSSDYGQEFGSNLFLSFLKMHGIKSNPIPPRRLERKGKGSVFAEQAIRTAKMMIERSLQNDESSGAQRNLLYYSLSLLPGSFQEFFWPLQQNSYQLLIKFLMFFHTSRKFGPFPQNSCQLPAEFL